MVTKFNLGRDSEARFHQDVSCIEMLMFGWFLVEILAMFDQYLCKNLL